MKFNITIDIQLNKEQKKQLFYQIMYYYPEVNNLELSGNILTFSSEEAIDTACVEQIIKEIKQSKQLDNREMLIDYTSILSSKEKCVLGEKVKTFKDNFCNLPKGVKCQFKTMYSDNDLLKIKLIDELLLTLFKQKPHVIDIKAPNMISRNELNRSNYLENTFHHVMFAAGLQKSLDTIKEFNDTNKQDNISSYISEPEFCMNPALCLHCYGLVENKQFASGTVNEYTIYGSCYRDEGGNNDDSSRLREFLMREYVVIGDTKGIQNIRGKLLATLKFVFEKLGLPVSFRTATDIFFSDSDGAKAFMQLLSASKVEIVYESVNDKNFSIGSINTHGTHFTHPYNMAMSDAISLPESMCCGIGYDRLLIALEESMNGL